MNERRRVAILRAGCGRQPTVRLAAVIAAAALVLHELRYLIGFGDHAHEALAARGHAYLPLAGGVAGLLLAARRGAAARGARPGPPHRAGGGAAPASFGSGSCSRVALLAVYSGQELLEAALSRRAAVAAAAAVLADGGWSALPLALAHRRAAALLLPAPDAAWPGGAPRSAASGQAAPPRGRAGRRSPPRAHADVGDRAPPRGPRAARSASTTVVDGRARAGARF